MSSQCEDDDDENGDVLHERFWQFVALYSWEGKRTQNFVQRVVLFPLWGDEVGERERERESLPSSLSLCPLCTGFCLSVYGIRREA